MWLQCFAVCKVTKTVNWMTTEKIVCMRYYSATTNCRLHSKHDVTLLLTLFFSVSSYLPKTTTADDADGIGSIPFDKPKKTKTKTSFEFIRFLVPFAKPKPVQIKPIQFRHGLLNETKTMESSNEYMYIFLSTNCCTSCCEYCAICSFAYKTWLGTWL